ncbi:MAG TPA: DUF2877 domain-containing protein [Jatrophihabitans sp.]|nr:DUF2877 domain-containing protein [Jatrophihabitans sp.]
MTVLSTGNATGFVRSALADSPGPARLLGSFPTACYLRLGSGAVVAVLTADAVQLPIGVTLPWPSSRLDLRTVGPVGAVVRPDEIRLGRLRVAVTGRRDAALRYCGRPVRLPADATGLPDLFGDPDPLADPDLAGALDLFSDPAGAVAALLGRGPGLTPAGDDLLCGALAATVLFGLSGAGLRRAVLDRLAGSEGVTTGLSRQLLLSAVAGDGLPELQSLGAAICRPDLEPVERAWRRLLRIGHSSGTALAAGLLAGARHATSRLAAA